MSLINGVTYLDRPEQWDELAARARKAGICGLDTEFYGLNVKKESPVGKARIHVWSVAIRTRQQSPMGYHRARGWVLPYAALSHPPIKSFLEDSAIRKCVHNQSADDHAMHNAGIWLSGCINTLNKARWVWPGLVNEGFFGLKNLMSLKLRRRPVATYAEVVGYEKQVTTVKAEKFKTMVCDCGRPKCRKRKGHNKSVLTGVREVLRTKAVKAEYPLAEIVPGHERWNLLVDYAAEDAVAALEVEELMCMEKAPGPWPFGGERPDFSQEIDDAVVLMERTGFAVDTEWCRETAAVAEADEARELRWLTRWFQVNVADYPIPTDPVKVWSSPKQLLTLFDWLGFPRSLIWAKGRVRVDAKMDAVALDWIAKAHPPARSVIHHLLHLKKIRANKKYLIKLRDCGGRVNIICGPAGDGDNRNGAVSGRLGVKGVLEAQQLPSREDKDLYKVRRAIIAEPV